MKENWVEPVFNILTKEDFSKIILTNARSNPCAACQACSACHCIAYRPSNS